MKVIILAAGAGSRMQNGLIHKALLPFRGKAVLSHIIEQFDSNTEFVVTVHHLAGQLKQYANHAHSSSNITWVDVGSLETPRAGPGFSLYKALQVAQEECLVVTCDTFFAIPKTIPLSRNWLGIGTVVAEEQASYCNVLIDAEDNKIIDVKDKVAAGKKYFAWTGMMFIKDWQAVICNFENEIRNPGAELQCSAGWLNLDWYALEHEWIDVGTRDRYAKAVSQNQFDYSKPDEFTYVLDEKVIKFFADEESVAKRVIRQKHDLSDVTPALLKQTKNFLSFDFAKGETFYRVGTPTKFKALLNWLDDTIWKNPKPLERSVVDAFYFGKTIDRVQNYMIMTPSRYSMVNGIQIVKHWPQVLDDIERVNPTLFENAALVNFHGDLQFDNIIVASDNSFVLIDWRESFGKLSTGGDIQYELAKLLSGLTFDFDLVRQNTFSVVEEGTTATISFARRTIMQQYEDILWDFIIAKGYSCEAIDTLRWMIIASMSGVHKEPYATALYYYSLINFQNYTEE